MQSENGEKRTQIEQELRSETAEHFRTLFDLGPVAVYSCDASGLIRDFNSTAVELWGRKPALGDSDERFSGPCTLFLPDGSLMPRDECLVAQVLNGTIPEALKVELVLKRFDDSFVTIIANTRPIKNERGEITGAINCLVDITDRKKIEADLQISEIRYRRLFEAAQDGILILDADSGKISDANPFMSKLLGYPREAILGKELWEIGFLSDKTESQAMVRELQKKQYVRFEDLPIEGAGGRHVEVEVVANVYLEAEKSVIQCNVRDITERSRLEKEAKVHAQTLAELASRKNEFLAMLGHELRNPLAPLSSAALVLRKLGDHSQIQNEAWGIIDRQIVQLTRLVDDLLDVSRISTGRILLQVKPMSAITIVRQAVQTVQPLMTLHKHKLSISLPQQDLTLNADAARIEQVVVNLLTNAAKFTPDQGQINLILGVEDGECTIRVGDNGIGIAAVSLPHIFELFTQVDRGLDRTQGGQGIGLNIVKQLVEAHGGRVEVTSAVGVGSEFILRLPIAQTESTVPREQASEPPLPLDLRILVVDDNKDSTSMFKYLLQDWGNSVAVANDGREAIATARSFKPDVILLDIGLPLMDGYQVAKAIRADPQMPGIMIIAITGYGQHEDILRSQAAGIDHHLVKPVEFPNLLNLLLLAKG